MDSTNLCTFVNDEQIEGEVRLGAGGPASRSVRRSSKCSRKRPERCRWMTATSTPPPVPVCPPYPRRTGTSARNDPRNRSFLVRTRLCLVKTSRTVLSSPGLQSTDQNADARPARFSGLASVRQTHSITSARTRSAVPRIDFRYFAGHADPGPTRLDDRPSRLAQSHAQQENANGSRCFSSPIVLTNN